MSADDYVPTTPPPRWQRTVPRFAQWIAAWFRSKRNHKAEVAAMIEVVTVLTEVIVLEEVAIAEMDRLAGAIADGIATGIPATVIHFWETLHADLSERLSALIHEEIRCLQILNELHAGAEFRRYGTLHPELLIPDVAFSRRTPPTGSRRRRPLRRSLR